ncbi:hypothetical protein SPRG_10846 [Saprolegnia parasitica CBS 223.65]|uniref:Uncharacterized protein n=1 Tax=Saprolegnia parasitica (strain CBS 223.65) TaxID=695850 RepID=A0A067BZV1_SAPPC|nr:hypothetical protein SPRG_10846 [Saprolegnia parasitica CBS 223.65]KDO24059.1 hypothetical protein SPRG_10846 [Saprolegnia parasitica CBS 223.65]|eukprot:XP_012205195.1 hypothetical protein SPRG_10846 [Saprolegnia parasitica CBS 223.65]
MVATRARRRNPETRCTFKLDALKREIYDLQCTIERLQRRPLGSALAWEDVAKALQDDMLRLVGENRRLQRTQRAYARFYHVVHACAQLRIDRVPSVAEETWRHTQLVSSDPTSRALGCEWILNQVRFNTRRAMSAFAFPDDTNVNVVDVHVHVQDNNRLQIHVATQHVVAYSLREVADAYWLAEQSFARRFVGQDGDAMDERIERLSDSMQYMHEALDYGDSSVCYNVLSGRFDDATTSTFVLRTVLHDEVHPAAPTAWVVDTKQWYALALWRELMTPRTVADALTPHLTRCRTYYVIQHPIVGPKQTLVTLAEFGSALGLEEHDHRDLARAVQERSAANHRRQRTSFQTYFKGVLQRERAMSL